jgi:hypothetical protein
MNLGITDRLEPVLEAVKTFIRDKVEPVDEEFLAEVENNVMQIDGPSTTASRKSWRA